MKASEAESLPTWALDLMAARGIQRCEQAFRKSHPRSPKWRLFRDLATRLAEGRDVSCMLDEFKDLTAGEEFVSRRIAAATARAACHTDRVSRAIETTRFAHAVITPDRDADTLVHEATLRHDARVLRGCGSAEQARTKLKALWPVGKPRWIDTRWPSALAQQRSEARWRARIWYQDAPAFIFARGTRSRLEPSLRKEIRECFGPTRTLSKFRGATQIGPIAPFHGRLVEPKPAVRTFTVSTRHAFRGPANAALLRAFAGRVRGQPEFAPLVEVYAAHDGAELFQGRLLERTFTMMYLPGLQNQARAIRLLHYLIERTNYDDPTAVDSFLSPWGVGIADVHVLAISTRFTFFTPLSGPHAGKVMRLLSIYQHVPVWSPDPISGIAQIISKMTTLARRTPVLRSLGDESKDRFTEFTLSSIRPDKTPPSTRSSRE
jgi:hypothetical protein